MIVRVDQTWKDQVIAEIDADGIRRCRRRNMPAVNDQRLRDDAVVMNDSGAFEHDVARGTQWSHGPLDRSDSVQTHFLQIASRWVSSPRRHASASSEFRTASRLPAERMLPSAGWKKQGRTVPSDSMTLDTHGALQSFGAKSRRPSNAS